VSYLQRLLDAAPAVSVAPGDVAPSPIMAQDQRLAEFPGLLDPFLAPPQQDRVPAPAAGPRVGAEASQAPAPDILQHAEPRQPPDPAPAPIAPDPLPEPVPLPARPDADAPEPIPELGLPKAGPTLVPTREPGESADRVETPAPEPEQRVVTEPVESHTADAPNAADTPVPDILLRPLWPIPKADFRPLEAPEPATQVLSEAVSGPRVAPVSPEQAAPDAEPAMVRAPMEPAVALEPAPTKARPVEPALDVAPSPLTGVLETATLGQPEDATTETVREREVHTVERVIEKAPPTPAPLPMTAEAASVVGPISIGRVGPRERRARC
jgi:hypothetical protein